MLMLCLRIACIHVLSVKALPEPPLEVVWIARYFLLLAQRKEKAIGKVQILAVLTMDGCHSSELYGKAYADLRLDRCDIDKIRENALYHITPRTTPSPCWTNGGKTIQTSAILRKPPPTIQIISTGYCVCGLWMRLSYIPCLSYRERDGISSSRHYLKHAGHSPHKRVIPTECIGASTHAWKP